MGIIKQAEEILSLRNAQKLGVDCFDYICGKIKAGMTEKEIASLIDAFFLSHGAEKLSFDTIVGSGVNSALIHSTPTERVIGEQDIILIDMGCILNGYCSDMSRTIFIGKPTEKQYQMYQMVYQAYSNAVLKIRPGLTAKEADALGRDGIKAEGLDYAHALGHGVGTEVHEDPLLSPKKEDLLQENMVFSIEPGIYLENEFGIRIEDVGVLTENGMDMFSVAPKEIIIL